MGGGALLVVRPALPSLRPFRSGAALLFVAVTLGLAAGAPAHAGWSAASRHGGVVGQAELWAVSRLLGETGAQILAVFLGLAGVLLLSGGSLASAIRAGGAAVARAVARQREAAAARRAARPSR